VGRASTAFCLALVVVGALPGRAAAHSGLTAPAATSYRAEISTVPEGLVAKVVDGDQRLWLRVPPQLTVTVVGMRGEPYLRFSSRGIAVNTQSATYFLNRAHPRTPPSLAASTPPAWKQVTTGHSTSWHEDRLHGLALAAHSSATRDLGRWIVPLVVDGGQASIGGSLWQAPRPSLLWFWPLALLLASVPALRRLSDAGLESVAGWTLAGLALFASTIGRLGRELDGRPSVSAGQLVPAAFTCLVAVVLAALWVRRDSRTVAGVAIGVVAVYQGLVLIATLRDPFVLAAAPAWLERAATAISLACGAAVLLVTVLGDVPRRQRVHEQDSPGPSNAVLTR
jgi:hypothetical protein